MDDYYLVDAKNEYTTYLISILTPSIFNGFKDIYEQSKKIKNENSVFKNFQILLSNVPNWNIHLLEKEVKDIMRETNCDCLDNLITAVFVSHSKILTSVKVGNYKPRSKKIDLKIPDTTNFIHQCYLEAARIFYRNPIVFLDDSKKISTEDYLKNYQYSINVIKESILNTIRKLLPFKNILNEYLSLENNVLAIGSSVLDGSMKGTLPLGLPAPIEINSNNSINHTALQSINHNTNQINNHSQVFKSDSILQEKQKLIDNFSLPNKDILEQFNENIDDSRSEPESNKEVVVKGKELILNDLEFNKDDKRESPNKKKLMTISQKTRKRTPAKQKQHIPLTNSSPSTPKKLKRISKSLSPSMKSQNQSIRSEAILKKIESIENNNTQGYQNNNTQGILNDNNIQGYQDNNIQGYQDNNTQGMLNDNDIQNIFGNKSDKKVIDQESINSKTIEKIVSDIRTEMEQSQLYSLKKGEPKVLNVNKNQKEKDLTNVDLKKLDDIFSVKSDNNSMNKLNEIFGDFQQNTPFYSKESIEKFETNRNNKKTIENESINIEELNNILKENGTILSNQNNKDKPKEVKKISIKYSNNSSQNKRLKRDKKPTLIDSADDTDSSEFIMK